MLPKNLQHRFFHRFSLKEVVFIRLKGLPKGCTPSEIAAMLKVKEEMLLKEILVVMNILQE